MPDLIERFEVEYQEYHQISKSRRYDQINELRRLERFMSPKPISELSAEELQRFLAGEASRRELAPNSVRKVRMCIISFMSWAFEAEVISGDRLLRLRSVRDPNGASSRTDPKPYSAKELKEFWREFDETFPEVDEKWWYWWGLGRSSYLRIESEVRRRQLEAIIALALQCGLRLSEIYNLSLDDLHPDNAYVVVKQRGRVATNKNRFREVPYTESAREIVRRWLEVRGKLGVTHKRPWIKGFAKKKRSEKEEWLDPMPERHFNELLKYVGGRYRKKNKPNWRLHRLRHTSATNWLRAGMNIEVVSEHLGHSNIQQTLGYAELVKEDLQRAVETNEAKFQRLLVMPEREEEAA